MLISSVSQKPQLVLFHITLELRGKKNYEYQCVNNLLNIVINHNDLISSKKNYLVYEDHIQIFLNKKCVLDCKYNIKTNGFCSNSNKYNIKCSCWDKDINYGLNSVCDLFSLILKIITCKNQFKTQISEQIVDFLYSKKNLNTTKSARKR